MGMLAVPYTVDGEARGGAVTVLPGTVERRGLDNTGRMRGAYNGRRPARVVVEGDRLVLRAGKCGEGRELARVARAEAGTLADRAAATGHYIRSWEVA